VVQRAGVVDRHHRRDQLGQAGRGARCIRVTLPQHHPRIEVDEVGRLGADGQVGLRVLGKPEVGEIEVVEGRRRRRGRPREIDADDGVVLGCDERARCPAHCERDNNNKKNRNPIAAPPVATTCMRVPS
jgi:hypothetical protein